MVGDSLLDDRRRRARRIGCDSVRRDRFLARAGRYPCPLRRSGTRTVKREYGRTVRRELAVAYGRAGGARHHPDYSLPAGGESGSMSRILWVRVFPLLRIVPPSRGSALASTPHCFSTLSPWPTCSHSSRLGTSQPPSFVSSPP